MSARNRPVLHWYVVGVAALAVAALLRVSWEIPETDLAFRNALTAFLILGVLAEAGFLRLGVSSATSSVAFVPFLAAVMLFAPAWTMVIGGGTMLIAETVIRRKPAIKAIHNAAKETLAIGSAAFVYSALGGEPTLTEFSPSAPGFLGAVVVYFTLSHSGTVLAVALSSGAKVAESWRQVVGGSLLYDFVSGPVALLLAVLYIKLDLIGILLVTVPLFVVRHIYQINLRLERVNAELLELMVKAIEARDPYTSGHSLRVSKLARAMAQDLGFSAKRVEQVATAALLHDVGKIYQEFAPILRKEGKLTKAEQQMMQSHPVRSAELVSTISTMRGEVEEAVRHHHESFSGAGYPDGLMGEEIPIGSRIIAIADTVDAMTTDRPYRAALPYDTVTRELQSFRGKQFDPNLVDLFCTSKKIQAIVDHHIRRGEPPKPKTVAETFDELRKAIGYLPQSVTDGAKGRWQRNRSTRVRSMPSDEVATD
jgi:putative nucleotidyltransferase with HDIG domain